MKLWAIEAEELGVSKCGHCNWETSIFYVLADSYGEAINWARQEIEEETGAPLCGSCMAEMLAEADYDIKWRKTLEISKDEIHSDVLERISGYELYMGG